MPPLAILAPIIALPPFTTPDVAAVNVTVLAVPESSLVRVESVIIARGSNGGSKTWRQAFTVNRVTNGAAIALNAAQAITPAIADGVTGTWDAKLMLSGNNVVLQASGASGVTVSWHSTYQVNILTS